MMVFLYLIIMTALIRFPSVTANAARAALTVWGLDILPTLFPYMLLCRLLSIRIRSKSIPPVPVCIVLGLLGGSPCGSSTIHIHANRLSNRCMHALCAMAGTISPMFFLGTLAQWTQNEPLCRMMLLIHWGGAAATGMIVWSLTKPRPLSTKDAPVVSQDKPLMQSIDAVLQVGGCIICFSVLASMLKLVPTLNDTQITLLHALLEVTGGIQSACKNFGAEALPFVIAFTTGFSGFSILTQNHAHLKDAGITLQHLAAYGLLRALCSEVFAAVWIILS